MESDCVVLKVLKIAYILECVKIEYPEQKEEGGHQQELEEQSLESFPPKKVELGPGPLDEEHQDAQEARAAIGSEGDLLVVLHVVDVDVGPRVLPVGAALHLELLHQGRYLVVGLNKPLSGSSVHR